MKASLPPFPRAGADLHMQSALSAREAKHRSFTCGCCSSSSAVDVSPTPRSVYTLVNGCFLSAVQWLSEHAMHAFILQTPTLQAWHSRCSWCVQQGTEEVLCPGPRLRAATITTGPLFGARHIRAVERTQGQSHVCCPHCHHLSQTWGFSVSRDISLSLK